MFTIPDKVSKLLTAIGIFAFGYIYLAYDTHHQKYLSVIEKYNDQLYKANRAVLQTDKDIEDLKDNSSTLALKHDQPDQIIVKNNKIIFNRILKGPSISIQITEKLEPYWKKYSDDNFKAKVENAILEQKLSYLKSEEKALDNYMQNEFTPQLLTALVIFFAGIISWISEENKINPTKQEEKIYGNCQSCGKVFNSMRLNGTNKDKSLNRAFCKFCYNKGKFLEPDLQKEDFLSNVSLTYAHDNRIIRKRKDKFYKNLERWKE